MLSAPKRVVRAHRAAPSLGGIVGAKEILDICQLPDRQVADVSHSRTVHGRLADPDQAIVANGLAALDLRSLQHADQSRSDQAARKGWRQPQDEHVEQIAIRGARARNGAEIVREDHSFRQSPAHSKQSVLLIELVLVGAPGRRVDEDMNVRPGGPGRDSFELHAGVPLKLTREDDRRFMPTSPWACGTGTTAAGARWPAQMIGLPPVTATVAPET